jgi:hypothetical protein
LQILPGAGRYCVHGLKREANILLIYKCKQMKKFQNLGRHLTKNEQKKIGGGCGGTCVDARANSLPGCLTPWEEFLQTGVIYVQSCYNGVQNSFWNCMNGCNELPY